MTAPVSVAKTPQIPAMLTDTDTLYRLARQGSDVYCNAEPFPYVFLPGFIKASCRTALFEGLQQWPTDSAPASFYPQSGLCSVLHLLLWELSSSTLIRHFASLTGEPPLLPDPFLMGGGVSHWTGSAEWQSPSGKEFSRHPTTGLQNRVRLDILLTDRPGAVCSWEAMGAGQPHPLGCGTAILSRNRDCRVRVSANDTAAWSVFTAIYYVNDHARILNGQEQPRAY